MLAFVAYNEENSLLGKWPDNIDSRAYCLYLADADCRPREDEYDCDVGRLICYCPEGVRRRLFMRYKVEGFGDPVLRTPLLQSGPALHNLTLQLAAGRLELIDEQLAAAIYRGAGVSKAAGDRIERARRLLNDALKMDRDGQRAEAARIAEKSLTISVPTGEEVAYELAQKGLRNRRNDKTEFFFGCNAGAFQGCKKRRNYALGLCDYATLPFYLGSMEPEPGKVDHRTNLELAGRLRDEGVVLKGHPLVWTYTPCLPKAYCGMDFDTCCDVFKRRIRRDVPPFRGMIDYWDIINEAHDTPWANSLGFTSRQMVELTDLAAKTVREVHPESKLIINICLPFGEYAAGAPGRTTPLEYLRACIDQRVDFDIVGVQFYYGGGLYQYCWDMLEIYRILNEYAALGKEVHITELGTPSSMGPDPDAMITEGNEVGVWHEGWSQSTQAEWGDRFYTICMSIPQITAATWWSFSDAAKTFWPHSGLLDADDEPKDAFRRLRKLKDSI